MYTGRRRARINRRRNHVEYVRVVGNQLLDAEGVLRWWVCAYERRTLTRRPRHHRVSEQRDVQPYHSFRSAVCPQALHSAERKRTECDTTRGPGLVSSAGAG